jgi:hypothetical protein
VESWRQRFACLEDVQGSLKCAQRRRRTCVAEQLGYVVECLPEAQVVVGVIDV